MTQSKEVIKPGETRVFTFTFFSSLPGQFHAQYYLETDPKLPEALPLVELSGYAVVEDENLEKYNSRSPDDTSSTKRSGTCTSTGSAKKSSKTSLTESRRPRRRCRTTPCKPTARKSSLDSKRFDLQNKLMGIYYNETSYQMLLKLREDVFHELGFDARTSRWDFRVSDIQASIARVAKKADREFFQARLDEIVHISRVPPVTRAPTFNQFRELAQALAARIPEYFEKNLEAQGFGKKKFKNDEEESKFMQTIKEKVEEDAVTRLTEELSIRDDESTMAKIVEQINERFEQGREFIDKLCRIKGPKDVELEGKRILARFSLQVKIDKCSLSLNRART